MLLLSIHDDSTGRDPSNEVYVPSDQRLAPRAHSTIEFSNGSFFIEDGGYEHSLSLRIGTAKFYWHRCINLVL